MSGYQSGEDKLVKLFEYEGDKNTLLIGIYCYKDSEPKLQLSRMFKKKDESMGYGKVGRISKKEFNFIMSNSDEIIKLLSEGD